MYSLKHVLVSGLVVTWWVSRAIAQAPDGSLLIQTTKLTPELAVAVAKVGREKTLSLKSGTDVIKVISDNCGTANARRYYLPLFIQANATNPDIRSGLTKLTADATLVLPACLFAEEKLATVKVKGDRIEWAQPSPISSHALSAAIRKANSSSLPEDVTATTKWPSTVYASSVLENASSPVWPSQSIAFDNLQDWDTSGFSDNMLTKGPLIVAEVTTDRLSYPAANESYGQMVKAALAAKPSKPDLNLTQKITGFERILRAQDVLASNERVDFNHLQDGTSLVVSGFAPGGYPLEVKEGVDHAAAAKLLYASLPQAASSAVGRISKFTPYFDEPVGAGDQACPEGPAGQWPINLPELQKVLEFRKLIELKPVVGRLLILDTGFPNGKVGTSPFDREYFIRNTEVADSADPYLWSAARPPVYFISQAKNSGHGVGVLTLALGGINVLNEQNLLASNTVSQGGMIVDLMGYQRMPDNSLGVDTEAVLRSLSGDGWGQTDVASVNLSLRFNLDPLETPLNFSGFFSELPQVLFVVASGNDSGNADDYMPARWGGTAKKNVLTVGGISSTGEWWPKSNQSADHVDIAAPGCGVPTLTWDGAHFSKVVVNGTSFSAPLASFAANLLQEFNLGARRKARILSSGRYYANLRTKTRSSRALDVPAALATPFDVVRTDVGTMRLGHITLPAGKTLCQSPMTRATFAQIHRTSDPTKINVVRRNGPPVAGEISFPECDLINGQLTDLKFQEATPGGPGGLSLGPTETLNIRSLQSVTFCDSCRWQ
jgi:Subtilase family